MKKTILLLSVLLIFGCKGSQDYSEQTFNATNTVIEKFPETIKLKSEKIAFDGIFGQNWFYVADTLMLFMVFNDSKSQMHIYNTTDRKFVGKMIRKGQGPDDYINFVTKGEYEKDSLGNIKLWTFDGAGRKIRLLDVAKSVEQNKDIHEINLNNSASSSAVKYINDSLVVGFDITGVNLSVYEANPNNKKKGQLRYIFDMYTDPVTPNELELCGGNKIFGKGKNDDKVVHSSAYFNQIMVLDLVTKQMKSVSIGKPYTRNDLNLKNRRMIKQFYSFTNVTDNQIWAIYENVERINEGDSAPTIHVFDWDLNPLYEFTVDEKLTCIGLDIKHKCLYGMDSDEQMYKYDISKFLD